MMRKFLAIDFFSIFQRGDLFGIPSDMMKPLSVFAEF